MDFMDSTKKSALTLDELSWVNGLESTEMYQVCMAKCSVRDFFRASTNLRILKLESLKPVFGLLHKLFTFHAMVQEWLDSVLIPEESQDKPNGDDGFEATCNKYFSEYFTFLHEFLQENI